MIRLELRMELSPQLRFHTKLSTDQKLQLQLLLEQRLLNDAFFEGVRGVDGMLVAHDLLKQKNLTGLLIGGLSEAIWNQRRKQSEIDSHKDVDVLVLPGDINPREEIGRFEGGIDWWLPRKETITASTISGRIQVNQLWFENGNGVKLCFGVETYYKLETGLSIIVPDLVASMRTCEAVSNINADVDDDVRESYMRNAQKRMRGCLPSFIKNLSLPVLDSDECSMYELEHDIVVALRRYS